HLAVERGTGRGRRGELAASEKLTELEVLGGLVVLRKTARDALQALAVQLADGASETGRFDKGAQPPEVRRDVLADGLKLRGLRRIHAAADPHPVGRHVEVEPGAFVFRKAAPRKTGRD